MMRLLLVGLWACTATLGATYGAAKWRLRAAAPESNRNSENLLKPVTVPIVNDGVVMGYVSIEFAFVTSHAKGHDARLTPESIILDEAFRLIYADARNSFRHAEKPDLNVLTRQIVENVNRRMGSEVVTDLLVKRFAFVPHERDAK